MDKAYLVVLGDNGNRHYDHMFERMKKIGQSSLLFDNVFVLVIQEGSEEGNMELVRNYIAGEDFGYCIVTAIDAKLSCAWSLSVEKSKILSEIVKKQQNEEK